ncbi:MAG TPA: hypothetical protein VGB13_06460 [Candidatus Krumholzibacteria bacterium]
MHDLLNDGAGDDGSVRGEAGWDVEAHGLPARQRRPPELGLRHAEEDRKIKSAA